MFKVPKITSVFKKEPESEKYIINFSPELISFIEKNLKVKTYRYGNKYNYLKVGDKVKIRNTIDKNIIGKCEITAKNKTTFIDLPVKVEGHESYKNKEHQRDVFTGYYNFIGREIRDDDPFLVFEFKLINEET